jgi:putative oxidoreductase
MATIAERAPGIPLAQHPTVMLVGRVLIAAIFFVSGIAKLTDTAGTAEHMVARGIPYAETLALIAGAAEVAGALAIAFGFLTRIAAVGLILFLIPTTFIFHNFWAVPADQRVMQMSSFLKNVAIAGGLWFLVANGAGRYSLDARLRRRRGDNTRAHLQGEPRNVRVQERDRLV